MMTKQPKLIKGVRWMLVIMLSIGVCPVIAQENFKWTAMNDFHATAMSSFHSAEAGKLQPARDSAASILLKAQAWQAAEIPTGMDAAFIKPLLQQLVQQCRAIRDAVDGKKSDNSLKPLVLKAHNTFHAIIRKSAL